MTYSPVEPRRMVLMACVGYLLALIGAVDPLEGSVLVSLGCALVALHAWLADLPQPQRAYRLAVAVMAAFGVGALWTISALGGFGGTDGVATPWALLILPYPAALVALLSAPDTPRWVPFGGCLVGVGYLAIAIVVSLRASPNGGSPLYTAALVATLGLALLVACAARIVRQRRVS